jgi:hypothetical protein
VNRRRKYDPGPVRRAFEHHAGAHVPNAFQLHAPATAAGACAGREVVSLNDQVETLTPREAWLVAQALAAGRSIETAVARRNEQECGP